MPSQKVAIYSFISRDSCDMEVHEQTRKDIGLSHAEKGEGDEGCKGLAYISDFGDINRLLLHYKLRNKAEAILFCIRMLLPRKLNLGQSLDFIWKGKFYMSK
jgi:hypothetical protein